MRRGKEGAWLNGGNGESDLIAHWVVIVFNAISLSSNLEDFVIRI